MNWFTKEYVQSRTTAAKQALVNTHGGCEHVEADASLVSVVSYENDIWGKEGYCMCEACHEKVEEEEGNELVTCHDCHQHVPRKETIDWKWYDFYAPQGDMPLVICDTCRTKDTHQQRVARDRADYDREFGDY